MGDNCKDCIYISDLRRDVESLKKDVKDIDTRLNNIEIESAARDEQIKTIFNILTDIKVSVKTIADKIEVLQLQPGKRWDKLIEVIIAGVAGVIFGVIATKF
jgi:uncharacterized coiled-coil protein SlyX